MKETFCWELFEGNVRSHLKLRHYLLCVCLCVSIKNSALLSPVKGNTALWILYVCTYNGSSRY